MGAAGTPVGSGTARPQRLRAGALLAGVLGLALLFVLGRSAGRHLESFLLWVEGLGPWGPVAFVTGYAAACVAFVPAWILTVAAGVLFGLGRGVAYVFAGAIAGSTAAFLVARHLARGAFVRRLADDGRFATLDRAIERRGLLIVFLLRLSPAFPFNLLNYALGLTRVRLRDYLLAAAGMLPGTFLYVYYGTALGSVARIVSGVPPPGGPARTALLVVGLLATVAVTVIVMRIARRALARATGDGS